MFLCTAHGASGKSTLIHVITRLLGSSNVSHNSLNHFNGEFGKENMIGRFAWILEESGDNISDFAGIKNIVEGNEMSVNRKNKIMVQTTFTLKVTLSFNKLPIPEKIRSALVEGWSCLTFQIHLLVRTPIKI